MSFCEIVLVGNLGGDPELQYLDNGNARCNLSLAVNRARKNGDDWVNETTWFRVTLWGSDAERAGDNLHKGDMVVVTGNHVEANAWSDKSTGEAKASLQVNGRSYKKLSKGQNTGQQQTEENNNEAFEESPF